MPEPIRLLRRLLYCGEWIESHALHIYMLHAPDFLGYAGAVELARDAPQAVERGLALKKTGNEVMTLVGGREIHPINVRVGGFYRAPTRRELRALVEPLERAREAALETVRWTAGFDFPERPVECELVALSHPDDYAIERGRIHSDAGLDIPPASTTSTSRRSTSSARPRCTRGCASAAPTCAARSRASRSTTTSSRRSRSRRRAKPASRPPCRDPFRSIVVRSVELVYACDEALAPDRRLRGARRTGGAASSPVAGTGFGVSEAPRGLLYHRYRVDAEGTILDAKIVPPTSQNQQAIEDDLRDVVGRHARPGRRRAARPLRADDSQLRPVHLVRDAFPDARGASGG